MDAGFYISYNNKILFVLFNKIKIFLDLYKCEMTKIHTV